MCVRIRIVVVVARESYYGNVRCHQQMRWILDIYERVALMRLYWLYFNRGWFIFEKCKNF